MPKHWACSRCQRIFTSSNDLRLHKELHHPVQHGNAIVHRQQCPSCSETFLTQHELDSHVKDVHQPTYKCRVCDKTFGVKSNRTRHEKIHDNRPKAYRCELCPFESHRPDNLSQHMKSHAPKPCYICPICSEGFPQERRLHAHMKTHRIAMTHKKACHLCSKEFTSEKQLSRHVQSHEKKVCPVCRKEFTTIRSVKIHLDRVHNTNTPPARYVTCRTCQTRFTSRRALIRHQLIDHQTDGSQLQRDPTIGETTQLF